MKCSQCGKYLPFVYYFPKKIVFNFPPHTHTHPQTTQTQTQADTHTPTHLRIPFHTITNQKRKAFFSAQRIRFEDSSIPKHIPVIAPASFPSWKSNRTNAGHERGEGWTTEVIKARRNKSPFPVLQLVPLLDAIYTGNGQTLGNSDAIAVGHLALVVELLLLSDGLCRDDLGKALQTRCLQPC